MPVQHASSAPRSEAECVSVLLPLPLVEPYDYRVPADLALGPGDIVEVPLGGRRVAGVVWAVGAGERVAQNRLKDVVRRFDVPTLSGVIRQFVEWVANYTLSQPGSVLRMVLNVPAALEPPRPVIAYAAAGREDDDSGVRMTAPRRRVLAVLAEGPARPGRELAREAGVSPGVVQGLASAGLLRTVALPPPPPFAIPDWQRRGPALSPEQAAAAAALRDGVADTGFSVTLLDGVTGSGKTEVYFEAIAAALEAGRQVLVLLPEIALGAQWLERFRERFGAVPVEWHSDLTGAQRRLAWRAIAQGHARVVVGARSALFLPFPELGLIIVDEEHEAAFKQEDGVIYQARDMAVVRAQLTQIPIVLSSATPSLETLGNVEAGRYARLHLPERHGVAVLPEMHLIDLREEPPPSGHWLSPTLKTALTETLAAGEQAMLFLNRRGYAPLTLCRACGHRLQCPQCTAWLVEHRLAARLQCHHCGYEARLPESCPNCNADDSFVACGPGVERLAEEIQADFPAVRYEIMASDTVTGPRAIDALIRRVTEHEIDLLIGTQIMAKGHHFPMLTLVGVVDADLGLAGGDLRAAERTFQLLSQVAGRAGRADHPGRVYLQTHMPESPVMQALAMGDRDRFLETEAAARRERGLPPFGRLAALIVSGTEPEAVETTARALGRAAPRQPGVEVLGPAPAPLSLLRGRYRHRLLMKAQRGIKLQALIRAWLAAARLHKGVRVQIDVDPYSFL